MVAFSLVERIVDADSQRAVVEQVCKWLAEANNFDEVKHLRDKAQAVQHYMSLRDGNLKAQQYAGEMKVRAERRLGELLLEAPKNQGGRPTETSNTVLPVSDTYADQGINKMDASRWQKLAKIPERTFDERIADSYQRSEPITTTEMLRLAKELNQPGKQESLTSPTGCEISELEFLIQSGRTFGTIYADPPWQYGNQATRASTDNHYQTMDVEEIEALPVAKLAAGNAHLHLWTTNAFLFECKELIEAWGFTYKSMFVWCKPQMGLGNYWRVSTEILLLGVRGQSPFLDRGLINWAAIDRGEHSSKPEQVRGMIEKASPGPRLELFARQAVHGWTVWGNQVEKGLFYGDSRKGDSTRSRSIDRP